MQRRNVKILWAEVDEDKMPHLLNGSTRSCNTILVAIGSLHRIVLVSMFVKSGPKSYQSKPFSFEQLKLTANEELFHMAIPSCDI